MAHAIRMIEVSDGFEQDRLVEVIEHDAGAGVEQAAGDGEADSAARSGDECGAAFERKRHAVGYSDSGRIRGAGSSLEAGSAFSESSRARMSSRRRGTSRPAKSGAYGSSLRSAAVRRRVAPTALLRWR